MKIIHLTDTHFIPKGETLYGRDPSIALQAAIDDINAHHSDAALVVITGDLTHWGEIEAFENLQDILSGLKLPYRLLVGNHDHRDIFLSIFTDHCADDNGFIQSIQDIEDHRLIFLDTILEGTHAGHYCETRQAWLSEQLATLGDQKALLFMHHPPFDTHVPAMDQIGLQQQDEFKALLKDHLPNIRHIFYGHVHRPMSGSYLGIPFSTLRAMNHQVEFNMKSETLLGCFEQPAYSVVMINAESLVIHTHDFMDTSDKFEMGNSPWKDWAVKYDHP